MALLCRPGEQIECRTEILGTADAGNLKAAEKRLGVSISGFGEGLQDGDGVRMPARSQRRLSVLEVGGHGRRCDAEERQKRCRAETA